MVYVGIVIRFKDKFLIQLRDNKPEIANPGVWGLFGGSIEGGENQQEAIIREIVEELGIKLKKDRLKEIYSDETDFIFDYTLDEEEKENLVLGEGQKIGEFTLEEIVNLKEITEGTKKIFLGLLKRQ